MTLQQLNTNVDFPQDFHCNIFWQEAQKNIQLAFILPLYYHNLPIKHLVLMIVVTRNV